MSIQSIHDWSLIKHADYSSPVLRECHHQANMAARCPDVENNGWDAICSRERSSTSVRFIEQALYR